MNQYLAHAGSSTLDASNNFGFAEESVFQSSPDYIQVIRWGTVVDEGTGFYVLQICPVIAGLYEIHVLLGAEGVCNQPFKIQNTATSLNTPLSPAGCSGVYVDESPYPMVVSHSVPSPYTSTAMGQGLQYALTGFPASFLVTVRDPWDNVVRTAAAEDADLVTASMDRLPATPFTVVDVGNGTYSVTYTPQLAGPNLVTVKVGGFQIRASPFTVNIFSTFAEYAAAVGLDPTSSSSNNAARRTLSAAYTPQPGFASENYSYALGSGLQVGETGKVSYFQVYAFDDRGNRITSNSDTFSFKVVGDPLLNSSARLLEPCPQPPTQSHPICDPFDSQGGHYFGQYVPLTSGRQDVHVYIRLSASSSIELVQSPFVPIVYPSAPKAEYSDVTGVLTSLPSFLCTDG